jgi:ribonuclease P protein component
LIFSEGVKTGSFSRQQRLTKNRSIRAVIKDGKKFSVNGAKLFVLSNSLLMNRVAFTFTRHYGNAVSRNKSRRISREVFRRYMSLLPPGNDLVFLVYPNSDRFDTRVSQFDLLLKKSGLLK